jgi:glycosyltransferase involved in cell wall biosynthesis
MKILITHEIFPPEYSGGGEFLMLKFSKMLSSRGHTVKVLTTGNPKIRQFDGIQTERIQMNRYWMNLAFLQIIKHAKDVDVIQTSSGNSCFPSWVAAKILRKPICCYVHHILGPYWRDVRGAFLGHAFEFMEKKFLNRSYDAIIFQNKSSMKHGLEMGIEKKRIHLITPGIDYEKFQMGGVKKEYFVLFVGNFSMDKQMCKVKGMDYLIEAAKQMPKIKFVIVGSGNYLSEIKKNSPKNVVFTGPLKGKPLIKLYNQALVYCQPSLAEGFGQTLLEAMASGCSIVSTIDIGQKGILVRQKSIKDLTGAIQKYFDNPSLAIKTGRKNREIAKKFTWDRFIDEFIKIYNQIKR